MSLSDLDFTVEMEHRVKKGILYTIQYMMVARSLSEWQYVASDALAVLKLLLMFHSSNGLFCSTVRMEF